MPKRNTDSEQRNFHSARRMFLAGRRRIFSETVSCRDREDAAIENQEQRWAYFIMDAAGSQIEVCFEPLAGDDSTALDEDDWQGARFGEVWKELAKREIALKLTLCSDEEKLILGLVQIGIIRRITAGKSVLRDSLLETAPVHRFSTARRTYKGIGRVLVARLVEESIARGAEGRLLVRPSPASIPFYRRLGFKEALLPSYFELAVREAEALLKMCRPSPLG